MSDSKFTERKVELRAEFIAVDKERKQVIEQRSILDRRLAELNEKIIRLDAAYVELLNFEPDPKPEKPVEVKVSEVETIH